MERTTGRNEWLSRAECSALRALAILGIVLHNYCHWLAVAVRENEYTFSLSRSRGVWHAMTHPDILLPVQLLSYFGHYGVPVFLFLSGFGLVLKYDRTEPLPAMRFVRYHYLKLFGMMAAGFTAFIIIDAITPGTFRFHAGNVIAQLLMVINLLPDPDHIIWPGPFWFFGLMMQLYIVYRLVIHRHGLRTVIALVAVCWLMQALCEPGGDVLNRLRYNCIGGMMPFCAGVLLARTPVPSVLVSAGRPLWALMAAVAAAVTVGCCFSFQTWLWAPLFVVAATACAVKALPGRAVSILAGLGGISAAMFVIHPILRKVFIPVSHRGDIYDGLLLYLIATLAVAWLFRQIMSRIPTPKF